MKPTVLLAFLLMNAVCLAQDSYGGGSGGHKNPYQIREAAHLLELSSNSEDWDRYFELTADIDMSEIGAASFSPIGSEETPFSGEFNGNGFSVSHFGYSGAGAGDAGLFGWVGPPAGPYENLPRIHSLGLINPSVSAPSAEACGALVGYFQAGYIYRCYAQRGTGSGVSGGAIAGGLIGEMGPNAQLTNCYSTLNVVGTDIAGGLVGMANGMVKHCYAGGVVSGSPKVGGLFGNNQGQIDAVFWDIESSGLTDMCNPLDPNNICDNDAGKTTDEMRRAWTFINNGWNFSRPIWTIFEDFDYPRLKQENVALSIFSFDLDGSGFAPPVNTDATGEALFILNTHTRELTWEIVTQGLDQGLNTILSAQIFDVSDPNNQAVLNIGLLSESLTNMVSTNPVTLTEEQFDSLQQGLWLLVIATLEQPGGQIQGDVLKMSEMDIVKTKIKRDKKGRLLRDTMELKGTLYPTLQEVTPLDLPAAETVSIDLYKDNTLLFTDFFAVADAQKMNERNFFYKRSKTGGGKVKSFKINFRKNSFHLKADGLDLSGMDLPFELEIDFGVFAGSATVEN